MTRGWAKSLSFKIFVAFFISFLLICIGVCIECASASEPQIAVTPPQVEVLFNSKEGTVPEYPANKLVKITNNGENTTEVNIYSTYSKIKSKPDKFILAPGGFEFITITALCDADDGSYDLDIKVGGEPVDTVTVTITYCVKIDVISDLPLDFKTVGSTESEVSKTIKIGEEYGYKRLEGVTISLAYGNDWVTVGNYPSQISNPVDVTFTLRPGPPNYERHDNSYRWKFIITSSNADSVTITVKARIMRPPKLGELPREKKLEIKFNKTKGTVLEYYRDRDVPVINLGDEALHFSSSVSKSPGDEITIRIAYSPEVVSKRGSENIKLHVIAPYDAPEGTYYGKLRIDAEDEDGNYAGDGDVDITLVIIWPVDFTISPPSIDFSSLELKGREYEKKSVNITLTEFYLYKTVRNLRFSKSGEYGEWLHDDKDFSEIPPGESRSFTIKIEPGLEAVPKIYSWKYDISASEISRKRMEVKAKIVPMNIPEMLEYLKSFRESALYKSYPSSEVIISNGVEMLEVVKGSEIGADDWKKLPVLMKGTLSLLSSLNDGIISSEEENYGKAVENLLSASVSTSTIGSNSELNNWDISRYAKGISAGADRTTEEVLINEAKKLELRGWNIKKAIEHAMAMDDISGLKEEENVLESAFSYQYAATIYGLLNDKEKRIECNYEESLLMDKHDELVSDATHFRIEADKNIMNSRENDLIRIGNTHLLLNPYKYDTFSESYGLAEKYLEDALKNYKVAGESLMSEDTEKKLKEVKSEWSYILSLFFIACILYGAAFIYTINRVIIGTVAYMRDMYEREVGDIIVE